MKHILVLRHAKSSWEFSGLSDFERPLAKRGKNDAPLVGKFLKKNHIIPRHIVSSPARRTTETIQLVCNEANIDISTVQWNEGLYFSNVSDYIKAIRHTSEEEEVMMLVGHNPLVEHLISALCGKGESVCVQMPTAALACIECYSENWKDIGEGAGYLKWLVIPKVLKEIL